MQFLPLYVTKNYIDPFPKRVINKSSYLPSPDEVCQSRLARYQTFEGSFTLEDKIKKSPLLRTDGELFRWHFFNRENKRPGACRHCKEKLHITETKDNTCRLLPLNLRSGTYNVEDLGECKKDKTILLT